MEEVLSERITDELVVFIIKKDKPLTSMWYAPRQEDNKK